MTYPRETVVTDFDQDGMPDIAGISLDGAVFWLRNQGNLSFAYDYMSPNTRNVGISAGDVDQDGDPDVLVCLNDAAGTYAIRFYANQMGTPATIEGSITSLATGEPVSGVLLRIEESGIATTTDGAGSYVLQTAPGIYTITTHHPCWTDTIFTAIQADTSAPHLLDIRLRRPMADVQVSSLSILAHNELVTTASIPIANSGDGPLQVSAAISGLAPAGNWLSIEPGELTIAPGELRELVVTVTPDTTNDGVWDFYATIELVTNACPDSDVVVSVTAYVLDADRRHDIPREFGLTSVYPNPFNSSANISYALPVAGAVMLEVYDLNGRRVTTLASGISAAGLHSARLDGEELASGVYLVRLRAGDLQSARKIVLLK